jgi:hypothetical protein
VSESTVWIEIVRDDMKQDYVHALPLPNVCVQDGCEPAHPRKANCN